MTGDIFTLGFCVVLLSIAVIRMDYRISRIERRATKDGAE